MEIVHPVGRFRILLAIAALVIAAVIWLPMVHFLFKANPAEIHSDRGLPPRARKLAARHVRLWTRPELRAGEIEQMRAGNAEWDFMGRTFLVLSLAEMSLREPAECNTSLAVIDEIIAETLKLEATYGHGHFLLPYFRARDFVLAPRRSLFIDSEIAMMVAARRLVAERADYRDELNRRVDIIRDRMERGALLCAESYPDECWMFDNTCALAALRMADRLDGTDHSAFVQRWIEVARSRLTDPATGLLISSFTTDGKPLDGPEGSTIWIVSHWLRIVDPELAEDQYRRAKRELAGTLCGFGYAREWPATWPSSDDVDSGPTIPLLGISAGSSGTAFVAAATFDDLDFLTKLFTTLDFAGFPLEEQGALRYCASNQVGDAVLLYATVLGPLWERVAGEDGD